MIEGEHRQINVVKKGKIERPGPKSDRESREEEQEYYREKAAPKCWLCGEEHFARKCRYRHYRCNDCDRYGHKEGYCSSAERYKKSKWPNENDDDD